MYILGNYLYNKYSILNINVLNGQGGEVRKKRVKNRTVSGSGAWGCGGGDVWVWQPQAGCGLLVLWTAEKLP